MTKNQQGGLIYPFNYSNTSSKFSPRRKIQKISPLQHLHKLNKPVIHVITTEYYLDNPLRTSLNKERSSNLGLNYNGIPIAFVEFQLTFKTPDGMSLRTISKIIP